MRSRRVLMLLSSLCAEGTPVLALDLARLWRDQGIKVQIATFFDEPSEMRAEFQREGVPVHRLSINRDGRKKFWELGAKSYRLCQRLRPDAVLCFPFGWHGYVAWGAALAGSRRLVAHAGNYPPSASRGACRKLALASWLGVPFGARIACCSDYVLGGLRRHLALPSRGLRTIHNGIRLEEFSGGQTCNGSRLTSALRAGMVARLEGHKDQPTLIRAAPLLKRRGLNVQIELVGDGSRRREMEELIRDSSSEDCIALLGMRRDIAERLASWDLFIFSVTAAEGLGISLIEALAAGVPVIASDVGACREVLCPPGEEPLGELIQPESPEALADAVERFTNHRAEWKARAARARESARQRFSVEAMAASYLSIMGLDSSRRGVRN